MDRYSAQMATGKAIRSVQAGRAFAAIFVMLFHMNTAFFGSPYYFDSLPFGPVFNFGYAGVDFFFVLSGFIIMRAHSNNIGRPIYFLSYTYKRIVRIFPIYLVVAVPWIILGIYFSDMHSEIFHSPRNILASLLLIPIENPHLTALTVAWTLYHEVFFYAIFSTLILNKKVGTIFITLMAAASIYGVFDSGKMTGISEFLCNPFYQNRFYISRPIAVFSTGVLGFFAVGAGNLLWSELSPIALSLLYGFTSAVSLAGAISAEQQGKLSIPTSIFDLGNASYALYLIHVPVISLICKIILKFHPQTTHVLQILFLICAITTVYSALLFHRKIELPILRFFQTRMPKRWLVIHPREQADIRPT